MTDIEQAEELVKRKDYATAKRLCMQVVKSGKSGLRVEFLLGSIALLTGDFEAARKVFAALRKQHPQHSGVLNNLAAALLKTGGDIDKAQSLIERAIEIDPQNSPALTSLGELYLQRKKREDAVKIYQRLVEYAPHNPQGYYGLGMCAQAINDFREAERWLKEAEKLAPQHPAVVASLLQATTQNRNHDEAIRIAERIVAIPGLEKSLPSAWAIFKRYCLWEKADRLLKQVIEHLLKPETPPEHFTSIALEILSCEGIDHATLKRLHMSCGDGLRLRSEGFEHPDTSKTFLPAKRMRIGYLSGDFRNHVASLFIRGLINHHDSSCYEIFLYSSAPISAQDEMTGKYFRVAEHFVHCHEMDDGELARRIASDRIHVLVDLSGFTLHTRMTVLTLQPAPVQLTYIGYPATYGLAEVDYIISNPDLTGSDHDTAFVEQAIELPRLYAAQPSPPVVQREAMLPCIENGYITFGSLINSYKINRGTIKLWAKVLRAVPDSRIYLNHPVYHCGTTRLALLNAFAEEGIYEHRVTITDERPQNGGSHYLLYDNIDIVLDATPMTGGAGTSDALCVGVPVISRLGTIFHERLSASAIVANAPDPDVFLAESDDDFVAKAVALAGNLEHLKNLRRTIRSNILFGPNSRTEAFTQELEALFRRAWNGKLPGTPIESLCSWEQETEDIQLATLRLRLPSARNNLHRFVARETGVWFEPECGFISRHATAFGEIWDISDDPGLATLPIALDLAQTQSLKCLRLTRASRRLLEDNCTINQLSANCQIIGDPEELKGAPLLIRIGAERNDGNALLLRQILSRCDAPPLIVLVSTDAPNGPDSSAANHLVALGYLPYRLHVGCNVLRPNDEYTAAHTRTRNVFMVIPEAIPVLEAHGLLCQSPIPPETIPSANDYGWSTVASVAPHSGQITSEWHAVYLSALNAYAHARDPNLSAAKRLGYFNFADDICRHLLTTEPTVPRVMTAIRLAYEGGRDDDALALARTLADELRSQQGRVFFEPFVAPHAAIDWMTPAEDQVAWAQSVALVAVERMRHWSALFSAAESTQLWKELSIYPWWEDEARRMLCVLGQLWE